jgi:hypothetical protein
MKRFLVIGLVLTAAAATGCSSSSSGGGGAGVVTLAAGSACNAASKQVTCSSTKSSVLACNGTVYQVATTCAAGMLCDSATSTCKATSIDGNDTTSDTTVTDVSVVDTTVDTTTPDVAVDTPKPDTATPLGGDCAASDEACISTCQEETCADEITACTDDPDCTGLMQCLGACTDAACQDTCAKDAQGNALALANTFGLCVQLKCIVAPEMPCDQAAPDFQDCLNSCALYMCMSEIDTCSADPTCATAKDCIFACDTGACQQKCATDGGAGGKKAWDELICLNDKCVADTTTTDPGKCAPNDNACLQECNDAKCADSYGACTGDTDCMGILQCAQACGNDNACVQQCVTDGGAAASTLLDTWQTCLSDNCL